MTKNIPIFKYLLVVGLVVLSFIVGRWSASYTIVKSDEVRVESASGIENSTPNETQTNSDDRNYFNSEKEVQKDNSIPAKVYEVLKHVRTYQKAPDGFVGGRQFYNREKLLPQEDDEGEPIYYQEWDVNPKVKGQNRGAERMVTSKNKAYYTQDHYRSFIEIPE